MNLFDEDLVKTLKKHAIPHKQLSDKEQDEFIKKIHEKVTFSGSQIDWKTLKNATELGKADRPSALYIISEQLCSLGIQNIIFIGDSAIEHAYSIKIKDIKKAVEIFAEFPQHTYIFPENLHWIGCLAFEGHIDYAELPYNEI